MGASAPFFVGDYMPKFKSLYDVKLEDLTLRNFIEDGISYYKQYSDFKLYIHNNVIQFSHMQLIQEDFIITTFTNGLIRDTSVTNFWHIPLDNIDSKDDLFNFSLQKDIYDLDLDIIKHIKEIIKVVLENFYDLDNNLI